MTVMGIFDFLFNSKQKSRQITVDIISNSEIAADKSVVIPSNQKLLSVEEIETLIRQIARGEFTNKNDLQERDPLFEDAAKLVVSTQMGSASLIQRRMKLGYNRAGLLMNQLELAGIIGPNQGDKAREVFIKTEYDLNRFLNTAVTNVYLEEFYEKYKAEIEKERVEYNKELEIDQLEKEKEKIRQTLLEKDRKKQLARTVLKELIEEGAISNQFIDKQGKREPIPQDIMDKVWNRDGGKCVKCGSQQNLEFDHIIPFSKGGATTYRNLQILCKSCNIEKSNLIG